MDELYTNIRTALDLNDKQMDKLKKIPTDLLAKAYKSMQRWKPNDRNYFKQYLKNLINNQKKHTNEQTQRPDIQPTISSEFIEKHRQEMSRRKWYQRIVKKD